MGRGRVSLWLLVGSVACGDDTNRPLQDAATVPWRDASLAEAGPLSSRDAGADASDAAATSVSDAQVGQTLSLPMVPATITAFQAVATVVPGAATKITFDESVTMAVGEGYPTELLLTLGASYWASCGALMGDFEYTRVEGGSGAIAAELTDQRAIQFDVTGEGTAEVVVFGAYKPATTEPCGETLAALASVPVEMRLRVSATRPSGVRWRRPVACEGDVPLLFATSSTPGLDVILVSAAGEPFTAANADIRGQVSLTLEAQSELTWDSPTAETGLLDLRWPSVASRVVIRPSVGVPLSVTVVDASAVTAAEVEFVLAGNAAGSFALEDGISFGPSGARMSNRVVPTVVRANVGADVLCSPPDPAWFTLASDTPSRCDVRGVMQGPLDRAVVLSRPSLGLSSYLIEDGACSLQLRAPALNAGKGLERRLSVTFVGVSTLHAVP